MPKPLNKQGGWLQFYFVVQCAGAALTAVFLVMAFFALVFGDKDLSPAGVIRLLAVVIALGLCVATVQELLKHRPAGPDKVVQFIVFATLAQVIASIVIATATAEGGAFRPRSIIIPVIWSAIWIQYFRQSRRVKMVYGANAFPRSESAAA